ncbi:MAG: tail fiber domain-containing protein [Saprospiraceae bacterium]|nr:tail fiber domain-containing protein [Saprospiraceae bacterium]
MRLLLFLSLTIIQSGALFAQAMTVDAANRVGVRETAPAYTLHVKHANGTPAGGGGNGIAIEHDAGPQWVIYTSNTGNELRFYRNGIQEVAFDDDGTINLLSDARAKTDIQPLSDGQLDLMMAISPKTYRYKSSSSGRTCAGFLAQDLEKVLPNVVKHTLSDDDGQETWMVSYLSMIPHMVKAMQEQQDIIQRQASEIERLKQQQEQILQRLEKLEKQ